LTKHWTGPFVVKRQTSEVDYLIKEEAGRKSLVVHHNRLKRCTTSPPESPSKSKEQDNSNNQGLDDSEERPQMNAGEDLIAIIPTELEENCQQSQRPRRNRHPPNRFGDNVYDYDNLIP
jgi:hypothetical protein